MKRYDDLRTVTDFVTDRKWWGLHGGKTSEDYRKFLEKDDSVMRRNNLIDNTYKNDNFSDVIIPHIKRMKDLF